MKNSTLLLGCLALALALSACKRDTGASSDTAAAESTNAPAAKAGEKTPAATPPAPQAKPDLPAPPDVAAPPADAEKTESGLASKVLAAGTGTTHPTKLDKVKVHYTGWTTDGRMFDSSVARGEPVEFPLNQVIPGWTEGVQLMVQGEKRRFWIPGTLAYGEAQPNNPHAQAGPPLGTLVFDVELLSFVEGPKPPATPEDVAAVPKSAKKTKSGLASRVLTKGSGKEHPTPENTVRVDYTGWTTDGEIFDSSVLRGQPAVFPLNRVIPGWTEGVQLMVQGEKRRLWIPGKLAYGERAEGGPAKGPRGEPLGTLVFDVELLEIVR